LLFGVLAVWFILFVFRVTDHRLSWIVALAITYALAAYVILTRVVRMSLKILQRREFFAGRHMPAYFFIPRVAPCALLPNSGVST
jgi:hypothetical protein